MSMSIPKFLHKYFWDVEPKKIDLQKNYKYFLSRILELGDKKSINWINNNFDKKTITDTLKISKLSPKSKNFWQNVY